MFDDVSAVFGTGRFLPYDKDRRWFDHKSEAVPSWLCRLAGLLCPCLLHHKAVQADAKAPFLAPAQHRPAPQYQISMHTKTRRIINTKPSRIMCTHLSR
jgi:hypothetical protein